MKTILCLAVAAILFAQPLLSIAQKEGRTPVIVELFTSEGCDTCPSAEKYVQKLLQEQPVDGVEIIALAEHVDYWNRLGWTDPFSSALFSKRQSYYAGFFKQESVYTPQMVVNGTREMRTKDGTKPLAEAAKDKMGSVMLSIEKEGGDTVSLKVRITKLPAISNGDQAFVLLAVTEDALVSNVLRGENSGRKLKHMAVVRNLQSIGEATGEETTLAADVTLAKDWKRDDLSVVAFVQEARGRRILGATKIGLKK
jgi:hypothetical protein